jgi:hypothetical protein
MSWSRPTLPFVESMNRAAEVAAGQCANQLDDDRMLPSCSAP